MKKVIMVALAGVFMISMMSCRSVNVKREACDNGCTKAKNECYEKAKDKKGNIPAAKKAACDATASKCIDKCAKEFGAK
ncbi:MAG: hypothetical protein KA369_04290 [Spirochaetes bacterium]|nr:hypothetical protein [Spirochaetota bacterium]